jgi:hypothetical protein
MAVRIFCTCGAEVTKEISVWDRKTRTVFWMDEHPPLCAACQKRHAASGIASIRDSGTGTGEIRKKLAAR